MTTVTRLGELDLSELGRLAELIALKVRAGDCIALHGDLGAGKTTFARALIRAVLGDPRAEVPSPTFPIVQPYETQRIAIAHFDLYRLASEDDLAEIGFADALGQGMVIVEWPERAPAAMPAERLEIHLAETRDAERRSVALSASGDWPERLGRALAIGAFLDKALPDQRGIHGVRYLQGDASTRAYARIETGGTSHVLMDAPRMPDGPPVIGGLPYSRIAHLAEDVRPFVAIGRGLAAIGMPVPEIRSVDLERGFVLLEDLGDLSFGKALEQGIAQAELWGAAVDTLLALRARPLPLDLPVGDGTSWRLPRFDRAALEIELKLILDWYWPEMMGAPAPAALVEEFLALWRPHLDRLMAEPAGLFLRDYHSPNLFWRPERATGDRLAFIDFQDALAEPYALDLVSLLQDARIDVPVTLEESLKARYIAEVAAREPGFDKERFLTTYAIFGAQRNTRLIGLWVRLLRRDGKPGYLRHMPRTWDYLARNLRHPSLGALDAWYERTFPAEIRGRVIRP